MMPRSCACTVAAASRVGLLLASLSRPISHCCQASPVPLWLAGRECQTGLRNSEVHIITGRVMALWTTLAGLTLIHFHSDTGRISDLPRFAGLVTKYASSVKKADQGMRIVRVEVNAPVSTARLLRLLISTLLACRSRSRDCDWSAFASQVGVHSIESASLVCTRWLIGCGR